MQLGTPYDRRSETSLGVLCETGGQLQTAKHSVEPALTVSEQDTYLYQSGWYRRVIGPFFGSDDPAFFVSVNSYSRSSIKSEKGERKWQTRKW